MHVRSTVAAANATLYYGTNCNLGVIFTETEELRIIRYLLVWKLLFALKEELHSSPVEEPAAVDGRLVRDVPHARPRSLHHVVTVA